MKQFKSTETCECFSSNKLGGRELRVIKTTYHDGDKFYSIEMSSSFPVGKLDFHFSSQEGKKIAEAILKACEIEEVK